MSFASTKKPKADKKPFDVEGFFSQKQKQARRDARAEKRSQEKDDQRATKAKAEWSPMNYVVWLLSRREYSRAELETKLAQKFREKELDPQGIEAVLDRAAELDLQSDARFLASRVRMLQASGKGPAFIRASLRQHDLSSEAIEASLDGLGEADDWLVRAYDLAERKFGAAPYAMPVRTKVFNTLLRRGFSFDQAKKVVGQSRSDALGE